MSLVDVADLSKSYRMGADTVRALHGVSLRIEPGEFLAVIGPSGSGKSTLMHVLGFLDTPTSGRFLFKGRDVSAIGSRERARIRADNIGFVFQAFNLLPRLNVLQNVSLPLAYSSARARNGNEAALRAIATVGLTARLKHRPAQLSGGERQRVAIARALVNSPDLILADEPTGNLDSVTAAAIMEILRQLHAAGRTIVLVTHDSGVAAAAQRRVRMFDGRLEDIP